MNPLQNAAWINEPRTHEVTVRFVRIVTDPQTDLWQRSFYGFRNDNAPGLLLEYAENFTFTVRVRFSYRRQFDQCGLLIYHDSDSWFKASVEYENADFSRLGSVVTNHGHSDWATTDIETPSEIRYRLSRRGPDFLVESAFTDDTSFTQMRVFHLHCLGESTAEMGRSDPPLPPDRPVRFGVYACSPLDSSFECTFDDLPLEPCLWAAHAQEG